MPDTAVTQTPRLIELIAWLSQSDSPQPISYKKAARHFGVSQDTIRADLQALVDLSDEHKDWLGSLRVAFLADGFIVQSLGAFRRPTQFTGAEGLALQLGLGAVRGGREVAAKFARQMRSVVPADSVESGFAIGAAPSAELETVLASARRARDENRKLAIQYCGSAGEPSSRIVHVHQIVEHAGRWYVIAWCEVVEDIRRFRADRILEARLLAQEFRRQVLFQSVKSPDELLSEDGALQAEVVFSKKIARWLVEKYPSGRSRADGSYAVTFRVVDPAWFVREVLQYGAEAEVLGPESLREALKRMVQ
ncbi:MAG TPA: WYL domain-containing protein [Gemmatimonadales bacterium]|nr:WYL domain-containing protein [Gemmatimonadales bacterium]